MEETLHVIRPQTRDSLKTTAVGAFVYFFGPSSLPEAFTVFISTLGSFFWDIATKRDTLEHTFCARTHRLQGLAEPARAREAGE